MKLEWKREKDGSYTSVAGRIWKYPDERWSTCCFTPSPEIKGLKHRGRLGNLSDTKQELERHWTIAQVTAQVEELRGELNPEVLVDVVAWEPLRLKLMIRDATVQTARKVADAVRKENAKLAEKPKEQAT